MEPQVNVPLDPWGEVDPYEVAWAAGFIDGEAHLSIVNSNRGNYFYARVSVSQRTREPLVRLRDLFGGTLHSGRLWCWSLNRREDVRRALTLMLPMLVVKQTEACLLLAFDSTIQPRGTTKLPDGVLEDRKALHAMVRDVRGKEKEWLV